MKSAQNMVNDLKSYKHDELYKVRKITAQAGSRLKYGVFIYIIEGVCLVP